jgi:hypothetical protein
MECEAADDNVEGRIAKWNLLRIGSVKRNVRQPARRGTFLRDGKHGVCEIDANHLARRASERFSDIAGPSSNVENAFVPAEVRGGD